ncbi:MAG TPA: hypothetical protein VM841_13570, partial [Actinomycetota bacterium]|nr:hypothetical protein [Actinomycetota bacterium]
PGWAAFFPIRIVLLAIRTAERGAGRSFELARNNRFIGVLAAMLGAAIVASVVWLTLTATRRLRAPAASAEPS